MTNPVQIPDAAVRALEALKKAEMFIENGVEYGFIRLPEKPDPALDTLPKIKAAIEVLTNEGTKPADMAGVQRAIRSLDIHEGANTYSWRGEGGDYTPKSHEIAMLADFGHSLISQIEDAIRALSTEPTQGEQWQPTHRHVKRGTEYQLIGIGIFQAGNWKIHYETIGYKDADMQQVAIYRGEDGQLWARPILEFNDGRFEPLPAAPTPEARQ